VISCCVERHHKTNLFYPSDSVTWIQGKYLKYFGHSHEFLYREILHTLPEAKMVIER